MINNNDFDKLKKLLLENFTNSTVTIESKGIINGKITIDKPSITFTVNKVIMTDNIKDFSIELTTLRNTVFFEDYRVQLIYEDLVVTIEL